MKNGAIITFSSSPTFRNFFRNPFTFTGRQVIQLFTPGKEEHCAIVSCGMIYEALFIKGVIKHSFIDRLKEVEKDMTVSYYEPKVDLNSAQSLIINEYLEAQLGKRYSVEEAIYSALDKTFILSQVFKPRDKQKEEQLHFCSKLCFASYQLLGIFGKIKRARINPGELVIAINESRYFGDRKVL